MVYFLINNNFHYYDISIHLPSLSDYRLSLIQVPHTLDVPPSEREFEKIYTFKTPFAGLKSHLKVNNIKKTQRNIHDQINPGFDDVLFFYTEFEILNQYIVSFFKKSGAKVYLIEEGLPTYISYCTKSKSNLFFKYRLKEFYFKKILNYDFVKYLSLNGFGYPQIEDSYLDGAAFYFDVKTLRDVESYHISKDVRKIDTLNSDDVVFLNEEMYLYYMDWESYVSEIRRIVSSLLEQFCTVYFKFHPREDDTSRERIRRAFGCCAGIKFVEENTPIEELIVKLQVKYAASFFSAALMNLHFMGVAPIYVYPFIPQLLRHENIKSIHRFLESVSYKFPKNLESIRKDGACDVPGGGSNFSLKDFLQSLDVAV